MTLSVEHRQWQRRERGDRDPREVRDAAHARVIKYCGDEVGVCRSLVKRSKVLGVAKIDVESGWRSFRADGDEVSRERCWWKHAFSNRKAIHPVLDRRARAGRLPVESHRCGAFDAALKGIAKACETRCQ